jgi:exodeoxyribonuclease V gamma subunit
VYFRDLQADAQAFLAQLQPHLGDGYLAPIPVDHVLGEFRLTGEIRRLTARGSLHYRCASIKAKDLLRFWVQHLVVNAVLVVGQASRLSPGRLAREQTTAGGTPGLTGETPAPLLKPPVQLQVAMPAAARAGVLVGREQVLGAPPLDNASELLAALLGLYWKGLTRPLKFFPQTAWAYAEAALKQESGESKRDPAGAARLSWEGNSFNSVPGECEDAYFDLCFRNMDPLDEEFQQTARAVFEPLLRALHEVTA